MAVRVEVAGVVIDWITVVMVEVAGILVVKNVEVIWVWVVKTPRIVTVSVWVSGVN